jgi:hypothetical protein
VATLDFVPNRSVSSSSIVRVSNSGVLNLYNSALAPVNVTIDVTGYAVSADPSTGGQLSAFSPARIRDTRNGAGGSASPLAALHTMTVQVAGVGSVPVRGVAAAVLNIRAVSPATSGSLVAYSSDVSRPGTTTLAFRAGASADNATIVAVGSGGTVKIYNSSHSAVDTVVDVSGYFTLAGFTPQDNAASAFGTLKASATVPRGFDAYHSKFAGTLPTAPIHTVVAGRASALGSSATDNMKAAAFSNEYAFPVDAWGYTNIAPAIGRLYGLNDQGQKNGYTCSGTVVARNLVLTASHCVLEWDIFGDATFDPGWKFAPQQQGTSEPYGEWTATDAVVLTAEESNGLKPAMDWALIEFNTPNAQGKLIGDVTGFYPIYYNAPGGPKLVIGYPEEGWFGRTSSTPCTFTSCYPVKCESRILDGSAQYHEDVPDPTVSYGGWWEFGIGCYMTGGSSGGPAFENIDGTWYVTGVMSHLSDAGSPPTYSDGCTRDSGVCYTYTYNGWFPYLNKAIFDAWNQYAQQ